MRTTHITIRIPNDTFNTLESLAQQRKTTVRTEVLEAVELHVQGIGAAQPAISRLEHISDQISSNAQAAVRLMTDAGQKDRDAIRDMLERLVEALIGESPHPSSTTASGPLGPAATGGRVPTTPNK